MNGLEEGDYAVLPTGGAPQRLRAMGADENHAAAMLNPPSNLMAEDAGFRNFGPAVAAVGPYQADGAFVQRAWAAANADALVGYLKAGIEGLRWASDPGNRSEAAAILEIRLKLDPAIAHRSVEAAVGPAGGLAKDARFDTEGFENMLRIRDKIAGTWGGNIPPPEKYLDLSYHERALAEL
jgi:ABC-type nitrate/sulfonate/bicarbonate transport system substrate-binding protein